MAERYRNKYRIDSARAPWWNYGSNAAYFVTICTKYHIHYFGRVINDKMVLSQAGKIADRCWREIPEHFPFVKLGAYVVMPNHVHGIIIIDKPKYEKRDYLIHRHPCSYIGPAHHSFECADSILEFADVIFLNHRDSDIRDSEVDFMYISFPVHRGVLPPGRDAKFCVSTPMVKSPQTRNQSRNSFPYPSPLRKTGKPINQFGPQSKNLASIIRGFKTGVTIRVREFNPEFQWLSRYHDHIIRNKRAFNTITNYIKNNPSKWDTDRFYRK